MIGLGRETAAGWAPEVEAPSGLTPASRYAVYFLLALVLVASGMVVGVAVGATSLTTCRSAALSDRPETSVTTTDTG